MESNQFEQLYKMMSVINEEHYDRKNHHNRRYQTRPYMENYNNDDMYNYDNEDNKIDQFKMMMTFRKMMSNMKNDDSSMSEKMMPYDMMKSQYNNKYGMNDNKMDMNKFEKMFEMISEMKTQKKQYEAPVAA